MASVFWSAAARRGAAAGVAAASAGFIVSPIDREQLAVESLRKELDVVDRDLKNWFLTRKVALERHRSLHKLLTRHNFVGLSINSPDLPDSQRALWSDLVIGKPKLEDSLSVDAREMKADMYIKMLQEAADLESPACAPGLAYLSCLRDLRGESHEHRSEKCGNLFEAFDSARQQLLMQQANTMERSLVTQHLEDIRAKSLFERRLRILSLLSEATGPESRGAW